MYPTGDSIQLSPFNNTSIAPRCILSAAAVVKAICHAANDEAHAVQFMIIDSLPQLAVEGQALMRSKHYPNSRRVQGATNFMHPAGDSIQLSPFNNTSIAPRCILSAADIVKAICHAAFTTTISEESQSLAYHGQGGYPNLSSTSIAIPHTAASSRLLDCLTGVADLVASVHLLIDISGATVNRRRYEEWV